MDVDQFKALIKKVTDAIGDKPVDTFLGEELNQHFPRGDETFDAIEAACHEAIAAGWMCKHEAGGIHYGRVIKPDAGLAGMSVDVVRMKDLAGPHHSHPRGEIDMIMPITPGAKFDGHGGGWLVYGPETAHKPTVTDGEALVLYLLPDGLIEFSR